MTTYLCPTFEEEPVWIHAIADGATNEGEPVENQGRFMGIFEYNLPQDIDDDRHTEQGQQPYRGENP